MNRYAVAAIGLLSAAPALAASWDTKPAEPKPSDPKPAAPPAAGLAQPAAAPVAPPAAVGLATLDALQKAVTDAWAAMPLTARRAIFVSGKPEMYGAYQERPTNVFKPGETLVTYIEPIGYTWTPDGPDGYKFGLDADFKIKTADGKILGGQDRFFTVTKAGHYKNQELMVTISLDIDGLAPGEYVLGYTLHDQGSDKVSDVSQPFRIAP